MVKELVEASPPLTGFPGADRDHLHVEGAYMTRTPGLAQGIPFQEPQEAEALEAAEIEAGRVGSPVSVPGQKHVGSQRFVALLGPTAGGQEGRAFWDSGDARVFGLRRSVLSGFFFRIPPIAARPFGDALRHRAPRTDARRSVAR